VYFLERCIQITVSAVYKLLNDANIAAFMDAGLTNMQARVFIAIVGLGETSAQRISEILNIDRANVYKTLKEVEKLELIEKYIENPTVYKAVPWPIAFSILASTKRQKYNSTIRALEKFGKESGKHVQIEPEERQDYFKMLPSSKNLFTRKWEKSIQNVTHSLDIIANEKRGFPDVALPDIYGNLLEKGVKIRLLTDRHAKNDEGFTLRVKEFQSLFQHPNMEMRFTFTSLKPYCAIFDNDFMFFVLDDTVFVQNSRSLWTNNRQILSMS